jgi:ATP-dependent Lon protease
MKIEETGIPNVIPENIDKSKEILAENIIKNVYPLFNEVYSGHVNEVERLQKELKEKRKQVYVEKNELQILIDTYRIKKKVSKLLDRIEKLINSGLVYDGTLKHETTILLKIATKLSEEKLDYHLKDTLQTISKRFSQ